MTEFTGRARVARVALALAAPPADQTIGTLIRTIGAAPTAALLAGETRTELPHGVDPGTVAEAARSTGRRLDANKAQQVIATSGDRGWQILIPGDPDWPTPLEDLADQTPYALWVTGNPDLLRTPLRTAITGSRAATGYGEMQALEITTDLTKRGHTIISGGAYGIDGVAHRAAMVSSGKTVAALAGGVDRFYPAGHQALLERIAQVGAVVSEAAPGTSPTRWRFLARNRLIAALATTTVIVEAGTRSGSVNTANHAAATPPRSPARSPAQPAPDATASSTKAPPASSPAPPTSPTTDPPVLGAAPGPQNTHRKDTTVSTATSISMNADDLPDEHARQHIADSLNTLWTRQTGDPLDTVNHYHHPRQDGTGLGCIIGELWHSKWTVDNAELAARILSRLFPDRTVELEEVWDDDDAGGERRTYRAGTLIRRQVKDWTDATLT